MVYIADMSGNVKTFYEYNDGVFELHGACKKCSILKQIEKNDVSAEIRKNVLAALRWKKKCVMNLDTMVPNLLDYDNKISPISSLFFNRTAFKDGFKAILTKDENVPM